MPGESLPPALSVATPSRSRGAEFGRYRLLQRIGAGGMAEIFRAVARGAQGFERTVAIKRIRPEVVEHTDMGRLFADEARVSALLDHPNIVQVYDFGAVDGTYYITMEYLKGRNLEQVLSALRLRNQRLAPSLAVLIARDVARGLAYAHGLTDERGQWLSIVHRDVSPANVMLSQLGAVKLLDFGIARITSEMRLAVTRGRALRGKCPYLAPEQINNEAVVDGRADIFALGAVLWEMLTGRRLFCGSSDFEVLASVLTREIVRPSTLVPGLPHQIDDIVLAALERSPGKRFPSAEALADALDELMPLLPGRQGDLISLVSSLPAQPAEELLLPVAPPQGSPARFELVLPPPPTPGVSASSPEPPAPAVENETTRKVSGNRLLAQLSLNPARRMAAPPRARQGPMLALGVGLMMLLGGISAFSVQALSPLPAAPRPETPADLIARVPLPGPPDPAEVTLPPVPAARMKGKVDPGSKARSGQKWKRARARVTLRETQVERRPARAASQAPPAPAPRRPPMAERSRAGRRL
jgi:serine/threonine protein kinase